MLDYDSLCQRKMPSISAIVHPGKKGYHKAFFGEKEILIPVYSSLPEAVQKHPHADVLMNFASFRSAFHSTKEALEMHSLKTAIIVAEGVPERESKELIALAGKMGKTIIGPATVGGIAAGKFRMGNAGGLNENILKAKLYRAGSVGLVSKSGGMLNELFHIVSRATDGVYEGIAIGGDLFPGTTLLDHLLRFESLPEVKLIVALGELGGKQEYEIIAAKKAGKLTKPLVMYISGTCAEIFPWEVQFGHAGAKAGKEMERAAAKNTALQEAGIIVPESFAEFELTLGQTFKKMGMANEWIKEKPEFVQEPQIPVRRKATNFTTTISSDIGEEVLYCGVPITRILEEKYSLGDVLGLLWFKKKLPSSFSRFLEMSILLCADHGPAVSGAHNAIVAARAGKDTISSLCSGLLTIGPRFGGALDDACRHFKQGCDGDIAPEQFVEEMKRKEIPIPGIGHRVKSKRNPDKRVELLKEYAQKNLSSTKYLDYALAVEKITLQKAENLILNVDGCLAVVFLDALESCRNEPDGQDANDVKCFSEEEIKEIVEIGYLNGLFALARSIGIIGHVFDQKRLGEGLYRHASEDISYEQKRFYEEKKA